jgi:hypothetical protein
VKRLENIFFQKAYVLQIEREFSKFLQIKSGFGKMPFDLWSTINFDLVFGNWCSSQEHTLSLITMSVTYGSDCNYVAPPQSTLVMMSGGTPTLTVSAVHVDATTTLQHPDLGARAG